MAWCFGFNLDLFRQPKYKDAAWDDDNIIRAAFYVFDFAGATSRNIQDLSELLGSKE